MKTFWIYILLFLLILYGVFLRFYELETGSFWIDEGYSSVISYFMLGNNFLPKLGNETFVFGQYFFHFFQTFTFQFLGISDFSARIPSFIFGILNILIFYFFSQTLLKDAKNKNIGIVFLMFLFLFSTWQIIWSREARFYEMLSFLYLITTFFFYKYFENKKNIFLILFLLFFLIGLIFHQFFFAFFLLGILLFGQKLFQNKEYKGLIGIGLVFIFYFFVKKIISLNFDTFTIFPSINSVQEYHFFTFFQYYLSVFYEQLGVIFLAYIGGILYFLFTKKIKEFIIFGLLVWINIFIISFGYFAHSRYMFHLFSFITLIGGYFFFLFGSFIGEKYGYKFKKICITLIIIFIGFSLLKTYNFTFLPQRFYYIDTTSPKPNFKNAYEFLEKNYPEKGIVSGFPHMCYWYNKKNTQKCQYAFRVNLIGNSVFNEKIFQKQKENYTNVNYIDDFSNIDISKYYFVLDDLTLKNTIHKSLIDEIIHICPMIYKDVGNYDSSNFIGIWKCQ